MKTENHGGPAFPTRHITSAGGEWTEEGMALRDYFAAKAMQGWLATYTGDDTTHPALGIDLDGLNPSAKERAALIARWSYAIADAMLAERTK